MQPRLLQLLLLAGFWLGMDTSVSAQTAEPAGRVLMTQGTVSATAPGAAPRTLTRNSDVFAGEYISTGGDSFAQIRMIDGAVIALRADTSFSFQTYQVVSGTVNQNQAVLELQRGGLRTITGSIGNLSADKYQLITPDLDIAINGTTYECTIDNDKTYCGVYDGSITVSNTTGSVKLGLGGNWDFAEAEDRNTAITPLIRMPSVLGSISMNAQSGTSSTTPTNNSTIITPLTNTVSFPIPQSIRVIPYKR